LAGSVAKAAVEGMPSLAWAAGRRIAEGWAARRLAGYEDAFLKDIGIPRCGIEDAVRHGRADRHVKR
jgi:hypothetical protein